MQDYFIYMSRKNHIILSAIDTLHFWQEICQQPSAIFVLRQPAAMPQPAARLSRPLLDAILRWDAGMAALIAVETLVR